MRKIILYIATSLDNYIARENGDIDWLFSDDDYGYSDFIENVDTVLMGRKTYQQVLSFGAYPYEGLQGYVYTRQLPVKDDNVEYISGDAIRHAQALKQQPGQNIWLVGGAVLIKEFFDRNLIDEVILSVHPILLSRGIRLFHAMNKEVNLTLKWIKPYPSGLVQISYVVKNT